MGTSIEFLNEYRYGLMLTNMDLNIIQFWSSQAKHLVLPINWHVEPFCNGTVIRNLISYLVVHGHCNISKSSERTDEAFNYDSLSETK